MTGATNPIINLSVAYNGVASLKDVSLSIFDREIIGIMGPANSGKSTLMRILNRLIDLTAGVKIEGQVMRT